jgi:hypothetical protein
MLTSGGVSTCCVVTSVIFGSTFGLSRPHKHDALLEETSVSCCHDMTIP